ncbi:hypothetical protein BH23ACT4_BH23ACT4_14920 [soil metagenome]
MALLIAICAGCGNAGSESEARIAQLEGEVAVLRHQLEEAQQALDQATSVPSTSLPLPTTTTEVTAPPTTQVPRLTIHGTLTLLGVTGFDGSLPLDIIVTDDELTCWGRGGYSDISRGAQVSIYDEDGRVIGNSSLGDSTYRAITPIEHVGTGECEFTFESEVPGDRAFYSIEVSHRGHVTYSIGDLQSAGGRVDIRLNR